MKQLTIIIKCPDNYVNNLRGKLIGFAHEYEYEILGIDVKEIEG